MLLTIGEFARASGLTAKALRLYDQLELLVPARTDPLSGYRFYHPDQLDRARLVAWLRRAGMPLARIRSVCDLSKTQAATEIAAYWRTVEADVVERRELVTFLIDHLSGEDTIMTDERPLRLSYAVGTDRGLVRPQNQDTVYADDRLLAVADGFGPAGEQASAAAIDALRRSELLNTLADQIGADSGTTLSAMVWSGDQLGLVHIGDSRIYLLRERELFRITEDHTVVQSMIDQGRITPEEAESHPDRMLLVRALPGGDPEVRRHEARAGDRYLLCSDGLHRVVSDATLHAVLADSTEPDRQVATLVGHAKLAGGPDNIACVVAHLHAA
ncbi:MerR family transcriptional regulator [Pseudonocardiaceae bacterium YIM PH 21723]|nr:MerR family transcriptional regulator [Pseudonocardiaceae bacterium YIM PH 21723]